MAQLVRQERSHCFPGRAPQKAGWPRITPMLEESNGIKNDNNMRKILERLAEVLYCHIASISRFSTNWNLLRRTTLFFPSPRNENDYWHNPRSPTDNCMQIPRRTPSQCRIPINRYFESRKILSACWFTRRIYSEIQWWRSVTHFMYERGVKVGVQKNLTIWKVRQREIMCFRCLGCVHE